MIGDDGRHGNAKPEGGDDPYRHRLQQEHPGEG
jgi:hypothetical protein